MDESTEPANQANSTMWLDTHCPNKIAELLQQTATGSGIGILKGHVTLTTSNYLLTYFSHKSPWDHGIGELLVTNCGFFFIQSPTVCGKSFRYSTFKRSLIQYYLAVLRIRAPGFLRRIAGARVRRRRARALADKSHPARAAAAISLVREHNTRRLWPPPCLTRSSGYSTASGPLPPPWPAAACQS